MGSIKKIDIQVTFLYSNQWCHITVVLATDDDSEVDACTCIA